MAKKPREKQIPFANTATEIERGGWQWEIYGNTYRWYDSPGLNFGPVVDGTWQGQLFFKTLNEAACFVEGFGAGMKQAQG